MNRVPVEVGRNTRNVAGPKIVFAPNDLIKNILLITFRMRDEKIDKDCQYTI